MVDAGAQTLVIDSCSDAYTYYVYTAAEQGFMAGKDQTAASVEWLNQ